MDRNNNNNNNMELDQLKHQLFYLKWSLFEEDILEDQYRCLEDAQKERPGFVREMVELYIEEAEKILDKMGKDLSEQNVDFESVIARVHQYKGSSASIGARRLKNTCTTMYTHCKDKNRDGCVETFELLKKEYYIFKTNVEALLELEDKVAAASAGGGNH